MRKLTDDDLPELWEGMKSLAGTPAFSVAARMLIPKLPPIPQLSLERSSQGEKDWFYLYLYDLSKRSEKFKKSRRKIIAYLWLRTGLSVKDAADRVGMDEEWLDRVIADFHERGEIAFYPDKREKNSRPPLYSKPEIIKFIAEKIQEPPPDGLRWKARHVQALMEREFQFQEVPIQRASENLHRALKHIAEKRR